MKKHCEFGPEKEKATIILFYNKSTEQIIIDIKFKEIEIN